MAQLLALDHPGRVTTLTLVATRPTAPGPSDEDLPDHAPEMMAHFMKMPEVDWSDRESVVAFMVEGARHRAGPAFDEAEARSAIERIHDRTRTGADPGKAHRANQMGTVFAALDCGDRWRERLPGITAPALVVHGEDDPLLPAGQRPGPRRRDPGRRAPRPPRHGQRTSSPDVGHVRARSAPPHLLNGVRTAGGPGRSRPGPPGGRGRGR
ncbi:alpha/beta hydrolase [Actinomadura madurae]|uniref:alpha/beta hydrolase n=1 Tax=Actinomadura madurae TaxID=1993 RepID=UPI003555DA1E